jgi:ubiquinone/menaquinone biosynthesis C-methylase UbiE
MAGQTAPPLSAQQASQEQAREAWQRVPDIFAALGARPGAVIADVGAGPGFFTERLARTVGPGGRVLAVDIDASALRRLEERVRAAGLGNVETIEGQGNDPRLPAASLDGALIVNAYHEMADHQAMLAAIRAALKPDGRLVIVEPISDARRDDGRESQTRQHEIAPRFVQEDARAAGFRIVSFEDPFTKRPGHDTEYLLVLAPGAAAAPPAGRPAR